MKIVKTASGKQTIKLSKSEWTNIGKKAGWMGSDAPWDSIPDELVQHVAKIARKQGKMVNTKKEAYNYAKQDEDALELLLPYADFDI